MWSLRPRSVGSDADFVRIPVPARPPAARPSCPHLRRERAEIALCVDRQQMSDVQRSVCLRHQLHGDHRVVWRADRTLA